MYAEMQRDPVTGRLADLLNQLERKRVFMSSGSSGSSTERRCHNRRQAAVINQGRTVIVVVEVEPFLNLKIQRLSRFAHEIVDNGVAVGHCVPLLS
jgi:hypothetical protein